jgi:hypothetical protein
LLHEALTLAVRVRDCTPACASIREGAFIARTVRRVSDERRVLTCVVLIDTCGDNPIEAILGTCRQHRRKRHPHGLQIDEQLLGPNPLQARLGAGDAQRLAQIDVDIGLGRRVNLALAKRALDGSAPAGARSRPAFSTVDELSER